ncbi:MAG: hypothetical protein IPK16_20425 [Anaerolineales bacterium]|nr:hypothetical protein [Anaerolineales bacterium]
MINDPVTPQDAPPIAVDDSAAPVRQPTGSPSRRPVLVTCLAVVIAGVLFLAGFGLGFATGHVTGSPVANGQGDDGAAQSALAPKFGVFGRRSTYFTAIITVRFLRRMRRPMVQSAASSAN